MSQSKGRFGVHGGQYIPETLMNAVIELETLMSITKMTLNLTGSLPHSLMNMPAAPAVCTMLRK